MLKSPVLQRLVPWLAIGMTACSTPALPDRYVSSLDDFPKDCRVRFRADTWGELISRARPTSVVSKSLLLWCKASGDQSWTFDLAQPFIVEKEGSKVWVILDGPENWLNSELEGEFVSGTAAYPTRRTHDGPYNHSERIAASNTWGEIYRISCTFVPGGSHGNQRTRVVLVWRRADGDWQVLWERDEATQWRLGSDGVNECYRFSVFEPRGPQPAVFPFRVKVDLEVSRYLSIEGDNEPDPNLDFRRSGELTGIPPMELKWATAWLYEAKAVDSWERLAQKLLFFEGGHAKEIPRVVAGLKEATGLSLTDKLRSGQKVVLPPGVWWR